MISVKDKTVLALAGIAGLCYALTVAWLWGINHLILGGIVAAIAGLAGYEIKAAREKP